jgi:hypothetical protein
LSIDIKSITPEGKFVLLDKDVGNFAGGFVIGRAGQHLPELTTFLTKA